MTQITIPDIATEVTYAVTSSSTGPFVVPFPFYQEDDVFAEVTDAAGTKTTLVNTTDFTFTTLDTPAGQIGNGYESGEITLVSAIGADGDTEIRIYRSMVIDRTANYPQTGPFTMSLLNDEQNRHVAIMQELSTETARVESIAFRFDGDASAAQIASSELSSALVSRYLYINASGELTTAEGTIEGGSADVMCYKTINCPAGTDPVAANSTDILNLATGDSAELTITGDSGTDTITFSLTAIIPRTDSSNTFNGQTTLAGTTTISAATVRFTGSEAVDFQTGAYTRETNPAITAGALTLDLDDTNAFDVNLTEAVTSISVDNMNDGQGATVLIRQHPSSAVTVTFPATWKWPGGTEGVVSTALSAEDVLSLVQFNSVIYASLANGFATA